MTHIRGRPYEILIYQNFYYNPRHHGQHYHVEYKIDPSKSWNNKNNVQNAYPQGYTKGSGTGFLPG
ncbi:MAG: hypothetical protein AB9856_06625 [Cellulosilyticaceae bacterium]